MPRKPVINRELSDKEYARILREEKKEVAIKAYAILLLSKGHSMKEVASILGFTDRTIRNWLKAWNRDGVTGLRRKKGEGENQY